MLTMQPKKETARIVNFLRNGFKKEHIPNAVIGLSGGVDSMTSYYLLRKVLPKKNIYPVHLPYDTVSAFIPKHIPVISIKKTVDGIVQNLKVRHNRIRIGNIMARVRMIVLFDLAKQKDAMVVGTENRSEQLLGYFTRFGDNASDIEPIQHLYKTQVKKLAEYLGVPKKIIDQHPTAGLWRGQTDEKDFGFTYEEADRILYLYFEKKLSLSSIKKQGYSHADKVISFVKKNSFKLKTPYYV